MSPLEVSCDASTVRSIMGALGRYRMHSSLFLPQPGMRPPSRVGCKLGFGQTPRAIQIRTQRDVRDAAIRANIQASSLPKELSDGFDGASIWKVLSFQGVLKLFIQRDDLEKLYPGPSDVAKETLQQWFQQKAQPIHAFLNTYFTNNPRLLPPEIKSLEVRASRWQDGPFTRCCGTGCGGCSKGHNPYKHR